MSEAKESENEPVETQGSPIEVLGSKKFPSGAQLTKAKVDGIVCYIRENVTPEGEQILELCVSEQVWDRCAQVIKLEDSLKREIRRNADFTWPWAEKEFGNAPQG